MEKALAKVHGNYEHLDLKTGYQAFKLFTGVPTLTFRTSEWGLKNSFDSLESFFDYLGEA